MSNDVLQAATWQDVAPLLQRHQMALVPQRDGLWDVLTGFAEHWRPHQEARRVPFARLPQQIAALAARCEAAEQREG